MQIPILLQLSSPAEPAHQMARDERRRVTLETHRRKGATASAPGGLNFWRAPCREMITRAARWCNEIETGVAYVYTCLSVRPSVCPSVHPSAHACIHLYMCVMGLHVHTCIRVYVRVYIHV